MTDSQVPSQEPQPTVLVVGANGTTAGMVVAELRRLGVTVCGMTRSEDGRAAAERNGANEVVIADLPDQHSLRRAVDGVDGVFLVTPAMEDLEAEMGVAMVDAAIEGGIDHFVFSSALHPSLPLSNHRNKVPIEGALAQSDTLRLMFRHRSTRNIDCLGRVSPHQAALVGDDNKLCAVA